jgi:hypothetical protein
MHLSTSFDDTIGRIWVGCGIMKWYSLLSIRASDSPATSSGRIGSANGSSHSKEDFGAFLRLSLQSQRTARAPGSNWCIIWLWKQRMKFILSYVHVAPFLGKQRMEIIHRYPSSAWLEFKVSRYNIPDKAHDIEIYFACNVGNTQPINCVSVAVRSRWVNGGRSLGLNCWGAFPEIQNVKWYFTWTTSHFTDF